MSKKAAEHHKKASEHLTHAAGRKRTDRNQPRLRPQCLPTRASQSPSGPVWLHEMKHFGPLPARRITRVAKAASISLLLLAFNNSIWPMARAAPCSGNRYHRDHGRTLRRGAGEPWFDGWSSAPTAWASLAGNDPKPVVLDFVQPLDAGRQFVCFRTKARRDDVHGHGGLIAVGNSPDKHDMSQNGTSPC